MSFDFIALDHSFYMREALKEATEALQTGEHLISAVIVHNGHVVGRSRAYHKNNLNRLANAEINALLSGFNYL
jgi:tRNA(adenine34) deaminase